MNEKAQQLICDFYNSVWEYMQQEYAPRWSRLYKNKDILDDMIRLTGEYYLGGNTVPFTAGQIIDLLKSKYKNAK